MGDQSHLNHVAGVLYTMNLFEEVPRGEEGNTILKFNSMNPKKFSRDEQNLIGHMLHTFGTLAREGLVTAAKTNDSSEIRKWNAFLEYCQDVILVWHGKIYKY